MSTVVCALSRAPLRTVASASRRPSVKSTTVTAGAKFNRLQDAVREGLVQGCPPFPEGIDAFGFFNDIQQTEAQRYADVEITHGRVAMLAALGFLVGEQVEAPPSSSTRVTGPAIDHFQQVPGLFWGLLGAAIFVVESFPRSTPGRTPSTRTSSSSSSPSTCPATTASTRSGSPAENPRRGSTT